MSDPPPPKRVAFDAKSHHWNTSQRRHVISRWTPQSYYHPHAHGYGSTVPARHPALLKSPPTINSSPSATVLPAIADPRSYTKCTEFPIFWCLQSAVEEIKKNDDGVSDITNRRCLVSGGTESRTKVCHKIHKMKCGRTGCMYRVQIREYCNDGVSSFAIFKSKNTAQHNHNMRQEVECLGETRQIHNDLQTIIDSYVSQEESLNRKSIHRITPGSIVLHVLGCIQKEPKMRDYRHYLTDSTFRDQFTQQIRSQVTYRRRKHVESLLGTSKIQTQQQLKTVLAIWKLQLPADYVPRSDYASADELAKALGMPQDTMIVQDLTYGVVHDRYKAISAQQKNRSRKEYENKMELSFFVYSPTGLYQLLNLAKRRKGTRQITVDGTRGVCQLLTTLMIVGAVSVRYRKTATGKQKVTSSLRPIAFIHAAGERFYVYIQTLYELRRLAKIIFDIEFCIDWGTSDHATAFIYAHLQFNQHPEACDDEQWIGRPTNELQIELQAASVAATAATATTVAAAVDLTEDTDEDDDEYDDVPQEEEWRFDDDLQYWASGAYVAATMCWYHVGSHVVKKDSFVSRFKDKTYSRMLHIKKQGRKDTNQPPNGKLYAHLCVIHSCKTMAQRTTVTRLIVKHWVEERKEQEAALLFTKSYGETPFLNWNYNFTGEVGVYPSNCPNESYNHHCVKPKENGSILNVSLPVYLSEKMPAMLSEEALLRSDPCTIDIPTQCHHICFVISLFYKEGKDVIVTDFNDDGSEKEWMIAVGSCVGRQIQPADKHLVAYSEDGLSDIFEQLLAKKCANFTYADVATAMVKKTQSYCHVRIRNCDGKVVGDCPECVKHLGYRCPAVNFIRSKLGQLDGGPNVLQNGHSVILNPNGQLRHKQRNTTNMYTGGLCSKDKKKEPLTFKENGMQFLSTLTREQAVEACVYLKLDQWCWEFEVNQGVSGFGHGANRDQCIELLQKFYEKGEAFRMEHIARFLSVKKEK